MTTENKSIFPNNEVEFTYEHHLNNKSSTIITKKGVVIRQVRERGGLQRPTGYWLVKFPINKSLSKIHESRLINLTLQIPKNDRE